MLAHSKLEEHLDAYITAAAITKDKKGPLFRTTYRRTKASPKKEYTSGWGLSRFSRRLCGAKMGLSPSRVQAVVGLSVVDYLLGLAQATNGESRVASRRQADGASSGERRRHRHADRLPHVPGDQDQAAGRWCSI